MFGGVTYCATLKTPSTIYIKRQIDRDASKCMINDQKQKRSLPSIWTISVSSKSGRVKNKVWCPSIYMIQLIHIQMQRSWLKKGREWNITLSRLKRSIHLCSFQVLPTTLKYLSSSGNQKFFNLSHQLLTQRASWCVYIALLLWKMGKNFPFTKLFGWTQNF